MRKLLAFAYSSNDVPIKMDIPNALDSSHIPRLIEVTVALNNRHICSVSTVQQQSTKSKITSCVKVNYLFRIKRFNLRKYILKVQ